MDCNVVIRKSLRVNKSYRLANSFLWFLVKCSRFTFDNGQFQQRRLDRLRLNRIPAHFDHRVTASTNLEAAVAQHIAPVARFVESLAHICGHVAWAGDKAGFVELGSIEVAAG